MVRQVFQFILCVGRFSAKCVLVFFDTVIAVCGTLTRLALKSFHFVSRRFSKLQRFCSPKLAPCFMQAQLDDMNLQIASGKLPPGWDPSRDRIYPFRHWIADLGIWVAATDAPVQRHGPMIALRMQGPAKLIVREMDPVILAQGRQLQNGNVETGVEFLIETMRRNFAPLPQEIQLHAISELLTFRRLPNESTDALLSRFTIVCHTATVGAQVLLGVQIKTWLIMNHLNIGKDKWSQLLAPTQGALPQDDMEYAAFLMYLRRQGHLYDGGDNQRTLRQPNYFQGAADSEDYPSWTDAAPSDNTYNTSQTYLETPEEFWDESSGCSDPEEPVDLDDVADLDINAAGETLYLGYRHHKRRFRSFAGQFSRKGKGKGKGKGKRARKGKGKTVRAYLAGAPEEVDEYGFDYEPPAPVEMFTYYKGKGKGGKGKGNRKNPVGPDGKIMTCTICESETHFRSKCPRAPPSSKGSSKGTRTASSSSGFVQTPSQSETPGYQPMYVAAALSVPLGTSRVTFADGSEEILDQPAPRNPTSIVTRFMAFMWMLPGAFHTAVRLRLGEGLLVDCGAIDNLCGDHFAKRVEALGEAAGHGSEWKSLQPRGVEGVGSGASVVDKEVTLPVSLKTGAIGNYVAKVVSNSELPGLLGLTSLEKNGAIIDVGHQKLIYPGPGGFELKLSPGSTMMQLERAESGHLLLPCTHWAGAKATTKSKTLF